MQNHRQIERRVFIVGVPRSGTTLVQSLFAAHSEVTSFTESHFFDRHFTRLPFRLGPVLTANPARRLRDFLAENGESPPEAADWFRRKERWAAGMRPVLPFQTRRVASQLVRVLDELTLRRGTSSWVEKTPKHLRYIPFLEEVCGPQLRPRFVHVIREGLEVVASLHEASQDWERPYDLETSVRRWNADVRFSLSRIEAPRDHFVFYEELTSRPEAIFRQLLTELDLDWEPEIFESYGRAAQRIITPEEAWKANINRSIRRSESSDRVLTEEQRDRVTERLDHRLYDQLHDRVVRRRGATPGPG